jgi:hypothetical protein
MSGWTRPRTHLETLNVQPKTRTRIRPKDTRVDDFREQITYLRQQLDEEREARRRADTIIAQLARANEEQARTIRELKAPSEPPSHERGSPETAAEDAEPHPDAPGAQEGTQRSWWRRVFGG